MTAPFLPLAKYSLGVGDRFAQEAVPQLSACMLAAQSGVEVVPVWNKSEREHKLIGSEPAETRASAVAAVEGLGWSKAWHVDADHIRFDTVGRYLPHCDFYTIDVADVIGRSASEDAVEACIRRHPEWLQDIPVPGLKEPLHVLVDQAKGIINKYLMAIQLAGRIYRHIAEKRRGCSFITEVSMDETDTPQTPQELLLILGALADEGIPLQAIAPKFSGRFNKGVDYVGDIEQFEVEFNCDLAVVAFAVREYALPATLKLSVHSGSDKFSLYPPIRRALRRFNAGLHLKTAGTTWLEELLSLAESGGEALDLAKEIYCESLRRFDELCAPYTSVLRIEPRRLPSAAKASLWGAEDFVAALRHSPDNPAFNTDFRQLLHVAYPLAAEKWNRFLPALQAHRASFSANVTRNLYERHIQPLFRLEE